MGIGLDLEAQALEQAEVDEVKRQRDAFVSAIDDIDDYYEYVYKGCSQEDNKIFVMRVLDTLTEDLLSGKPEEETECES